MICECIGWCRNPISLKVGGFSYIPDHHESCPHYNDSLVEMAVINLDGVKTIQLGVEGRAIFKEMVQDDFEKILSCEIVKVHAEALETIPEFTGY